MKAVLIAALVMVGGSPAPWVIDGDTIVFGSEHVRVSNLDAPDIGAHAKCEAERIRGQAAKAYAIQLVRSAQAVTITRRQGFDKYGRTRARVLIDGVDFGRLMVEADHGRPWRGRSSNWCT